MDILILPLLACIILVCIHVYFGSFVLKRGIIFIDLALAQWAALGYIVGHLLHIHSHTLLFLTSFGFTAIAAVILSALKHLYQANNLQEAVIGVTYIAANAIAIGLISSFGLDGHHFQEMLTGHLLFIHPSEIITTYLTYFCIGLLLIKLHPFFVKNTSPKWDFIFYLLFGLVVTSSVKMVGILLVFSFLVIPLLSIIRLTNSFKQQLNYGWIIGIMASIIGLLLSLLIDVPPSIAIIIVLISIWIATTLYYKLFITKQNLNP